MKTNKEVLKIAEKYLGQGGARFRKFCGLPSNAAWCNAYVDYVANEGGVAKLYFDGKRMTYCPTSYKWCQKNLAQIPLYLAMEGDIIYFDWDKNGVPNHIGMVVHRKSPTQIRTIEGNTSGGIVAKKIRTSGYVCGVFRPKYSPQVIKIGIIDVDGAFQYQSIANMERALNMTPTGILTKDVVKALQRRAKCKDIDGAWGPKTSLAVQRMVGIKKPTGNFGEASTKALQRWINKQNNKEDDVTPEPIPEPSPVPDKPKTNAEMIIDKIDEYAYAYKTSKKKYAYKGGHPKLAYKDAIKKYMKKSAKISQSDCGYFVTTVVRGSGVSKTFMALRGRKESFPSLPSTMKYVHKGGAIPKGLLKPGDIIRYKKKGGGQHTLFYYGNGKIAEAGRGHYFPAIKKNTKKYNKSNVKKSTIQVIRAKE